MQKIDVKNFGAVKNAEVDIRKVLVLIGEQASGKSTIAKLIYFFTSLRDDLFNQLYKDTATKDFDFASDLIFPIREKFYDFFGSTFHLPNFEITFYYDVEKRRFLRLTLDRQTKRLHPRFSDNFVDNNFKSSVRQIKTFLQKNFNINKVHEHLAFEQDKLKFAQRLSSLVNKLFESHQDDALFIIAGRNATVSYSELFEKYLFANIQSKLEENSKQIFKRKEQTIDETLMLRFMERVEKIRETFSKFGNFEGLIQSLNDESDKKFLHKVHTLINKILKGKYTIDNWGERIVFNSGTGEYIHLSNASSGQQESIRILQDLFLLILDNQRSLRIIEEPEAHLFPVAQKQTIELLALMLNQNSDNQLIITTHSPYVLTVFNNLLFAQRVVEKNSNAEATVNKIVPKEFRLKAKEFSAYSLGNDTFEEQINYCDSIFNLETGLIDQNYLDTVSELLSGDFNELYNTHAQFFGRR